MENWVREGQKQQERPFGGFDAWSRAVGGIMAGSGFARFLTNQREFCDQSDEETAGLDAFVRRWHECFAVEWVSAGTLVKMIVDTELLPEVQGATGARGQATRMGSYLRRYVDAPVRQWRICSRQGRDGRLYALKMRESRHVLNVGIGA